ncbi:hypothetical protein HETIRDRAFT_309020 [Heterobasidion irregulare TC 32-1]|uniref:Protein CPL1-like domain-containing protein n=1 Tax=Heterobasidion irregulare (strain TC 32-1) TaxID=747525 RepID=W4KHW6_HETIT|nr:uncharacterized protein HETIRDRAFT_309020 [Heterobasidion irregulare TC 32-1]ETW85437.1 hypothetical protein HETIRDRAFT_309020 [Heterobasidion irregulare TC 32-1]
MEYVPIQDFINPDSVSYASIHTDDISDQLCPSGLSVCPFVNQAESQPQGLAWSETWTLDNLVNHGFNCPNFDRDLENCGGCSVLDATFNCSDISNAVKTSCVTGRCIVGSCDEGYAISYMQDRCVIMND